MASIRITLKSDLCAGSGEATGVAVDKDLCISQAGLPYIPARRLKGCLREAAELLQRMGCPDASAPNIEALFGSSAGVEGCLDLRDALLPDAEIMERWLRSGLPNQLREAAAPLNVARLFTCVRGQTKLKDGVAETGTLRYTRVLNHYSALLPEQETFLEAKVSLRSGSADADPGSLALLLEKACKALRHLGSMRNRGLGEIRAELLDRDSLIPGTGADWSSRPADACGEPDTLIRYRIALDAPVTLPGCSEELTEIPARSVIGCAAGAYLQNGSPADPLFRRLFLDGTVRWSALTPAVDGKRSVPTPLMLVRLKNEKKYHNLYAAGSAQGKKQKTLEGSYAVPTKAGYRITKVKTHTVYHHSTGPDGTLYMQSSLDAGMIYSGELRLPAALAEPVKELLQRTRFAFGRSRSAQYAACSLLGEPTEAPLRNELRATEDGAPIYAVLQSDLLLSEGGLYETRNDAVRAALAKALNLDAAPVEDTPDYCLYHSVGGYQMSWQLQKSQIPAVRGGSVYVLRSKGGRIPLWLTLGELTQEGFGLFRIYTRQEMDGLLQIEEASVDTRQADREQSASCAELRSALLTAAACEAVRDSVIRLHKYEKVTKNLNKGTVGRIRLMLSEAESYDEFYKNVQTIKDSDRHSGNQTSQREWVNELLKTVYGKTPPSFDALLGKSAAGQPLVDLIQKDPSAQRRLNQKWKEPLDMLLHLAHYGMTKGGR